MKTKLKLLTVIAISIMFLFPIHIEARSVSKENHINEVSKYVQIQAKSKKSKKIKDLGTSFETDPESSCTSLLGNPTNPDSVAWLLVKILQYIRILGPLAVIVLSAIEFTKTIVLSDDDAMKKAVNHLTIRLVLVAVLFLVPTITEVLLRVFNVISDPMCGIN